MIWMITIMMMKTIRMMIMMIFVAVVDAAGEKGVKSEKEHNSLIDSTGLTKTCQHKWADP